MCISKAQNLIYFAQKRWILSYNLYQSSETQFYDMWPGLNYHHLLIISHDMKYYDCDKTIYVKTFV